MGGGVVLAAAAEVIFELACGATGHGLLWLVTLGHWRAFEGRDGVATIVGVLFWALVVGVVALLTWR
jgi:hypothetical protein